MTDEPREPVEITRRVVRVKPNRYQPTRAEVEEPILIRKADGTVPTPEELARVAFAPVTLIEDPEA